MKAVVFSIGETTTDLCIWSLKRNGFDVVLYRDRNSLWHKLNQMYHEFDEDLVRVDADVVPNKHLTPDNVIEIANKNSSAWWLQFLTYDWFKQDTTHGGISFIKQKAFTAIRKHINEHEYKERPETELYRLSEFHDPRRCVSVERIMGIHGYAVRDIRRVRETKIRRGQIENYDFELARKLGEL